MILVAGHFGTLYSYATVAGHVAEALRAHGLLAGCQNIDSAWHPHWKHLQGMTADPTHSLVISAPNHYITGYADMVGRDRAAIFVSPNTDRIADEHAETISKFGLAIAPSRFCANTVGKRCSIDTVVLGLGSPVERSALIMAARSERKARLSSGKVEVVHFTSDQAWPSRKGTEMLIEAWASRDPGPDDYLTIHGPPSLRKSALYAIADARLDETVSYEPSPPMGTTDEDLCRLFARADVVVAPSRAEGFGMMMLASLVAQVPLLTTCTTGHSEFLRMWPGAWLPIPTPGSGPLAYEEGEAPQIDVGAMTDMLDLSMTTFARTRMLAAAAQHGETHGPSWGTWAATLPQWVERLKEWIGGTT